MTLPLALLVLAFVPMAVEARRSRMNDRTLRLQGAVDQPGDVYGVMQFAYPACFAAIVFEGWLRGSRATPTFAAGVAVFVASKALKYWAIAALGPRWTFRVLVPPGSSRVVTGPYRHLRHPNYLGVAGELLGMALMAQAPLTGFLGLVGFGSLLLARIRVEEQALGTKN